MLKPFASCRPEACLLTTTPCIRPYTAAPCSPIQYSHQQAPPTAGKVITCSREIGLIWYLTKDWRGEFGGALVDLEAPGGPANYVPLFNSLVAFRWGLGAAGQQAGGVHVRVFCSGPAVCTASIRSRANVARLSMGGGATKNSWRASCAGCRVPRYHEVTPVATSRARYSIFGWFLQPGRRYELYTGAEAAQQAQQAQRGGKAAPPAAAGPGQEPVGPTPQAKRQRQRQQQQGKGAEEEHKEQDQGGARGGRLSLGVGGGSGGHRAAARLKAGAGPGSAAEGQQEQEQEHCEERAIEYSCKLAQRIAANAAKRRRKQGAMAAGEDKP
jgi:hypothetical protein